MEKNSDEGISINLENVSLSNTGSDVNDTIFKACGLNAAASVYF